VVAGITHHHPMLYGGWLVSARSEHY
jgi:hypothetical protein